MPIPLAKDRTRTEHIATVRRLRWNADDGSACILELTDDLTAKGQFDGMEFHGGTIYRFYGRWKHDPKWGDQFEFSSYVVHSFGSHRGVTVYLQKFCDNIGEKSAEKLWQKYGADAVRILRDSPQQVADDGVLSREIALGASATLAAEKHLEATRIDLFGLLNGRGFHGRIVQQAITRWGAKAPAIIKADPFKLLGLAGAGFKRCDKMWLELSLNPARLKRQVWATVNQIRTDRDGHTWLDGTKAVQCVRDAVGEKVAHPRNAIRCGLRAKLLVGRTENGRPWITLRERAEAERRIADNIKRLMSRPSRWAIDDVVESVEEGDGLPSAHQVGELRKACGGAVGLLTGGPGTGKTHTLSFLLKATIAHYGSEKMRVAAPTGKASVRATESLRSREINDIRGTTIHGLLEVSTNGHGVGSSWGFLRNRDDPIDCEFLIVDETSMNDTPLMADLLDAVPTGCCVLFIGDPHQLPPVGYGAPLRDMIAASLPCGELAEVRRNAGRIVHACKAIKEARPIEFSPRIDLENGENLRLVECGNNEVMTKVLQIMEQGIKGFNPVWETQIIVGLNEKGNCSRTDLNDKLQKLLNPNGISHPKCRFRVGDKIICTSNTRLNIVCLKSASSHGWGKPKAVYLPSEIELAKVESYVDDKGNGVEPVYVANGEIGRVVAIGEKSCVASFGESKTLLRIGKAAPSATPSASRGENGETSGDGGSSDASQFDLAYAVTCHKMQGSESPCVIVCLDDAASAIADRSWHYTAISRASKLCVVVGSATTLRKQALRVSLTKRKTFQVEEIRERMATAAVAEVAQ
jgi:exodeoxyribonuclease V alpha subunit